MKVEITASELNQLIEDNKNLKAKVNELERSLSRFEENKVHHNALLLSENMLKVYLKTLFTELGFNDTKYYETVQVNLEPERYVANYFELYSNELEKTIKFELGSTVTNTVRKAFININKPEKLK